MSRVQRSPPPNTTNIITQTSSDSDIPQLISSSPYEDVNITMRHKRPRTTFSPGSELQDFKREIHEMLLNWKTDQETYLAKFCKDQSSTLNKLVSELAEVKAQNQVIQKSNTEIEKSITFINKRYDDMIKQLEALEKDKQTHRQNILNLESKIKDLQRSLSRPSSIEIRNIPSVENETAEQLTTIVNKVSSAIEMPLNNIDLRDVYRLPGKQGTVRPIVAEFNNVQVKNKFLSTARNFNRNHKNEDRLSTLNIGLTGERRPIFVSEYLPASLRKLFFTAKEFAKHGKYEFCWTTNGNIFLRKAVGSKQILIKSEETLRELQQHADQ